MKNLSEWWLDRVADEIDATLPKAAEYGSNELVDLGRTLARASGREGLSDAQAAELAIFFYARGKMARWDAAVARGDAVSDDTIHDLGVYTKMVQRLREDGVWPGEV